MNGGIVIKTNNNQRYTTNGVTGFFVRELGRRSGVPIQEFAVRNDCPCGSTIGPMLSTSTGIRAVDLGMPQLSMHSIREMMGVADLQHGVDLFKAYFRDFREVEGAIKIDPTVPL
ncbi:peptidase M18 [Ochromonadaceae sp. CCMP2298]|nr:peptidase M18 [Ochromonadaceae sp. CCMP2298]